MSTLTKTPINTLINVAVQLHAGAAIDDRLRALEDYSKRGLVVPLTRSPRWLSVMSKGLQHDVYVLEAQRGDRTTGMVGLADVRSRLFGRYLVSLPYLNSAGLQADDSESATALIDAAAALADRLDVQYLELRNEAAQDHPKLAHRRMNKVHMRLELPTTGAALWEQISAKVRNQIRKGQKHGYCAHWGGADLLEDFYQVFSRNMRDLGTPTYGRELFATILEQFSDAAELCVLRDEGKPIAGALLIHGRGVTEVPSASSLRAYNASCANMLMYWHLLERAAEKKQSVFDFGRSTEASATYRFKKQWGAIATPAEWQYYLRSGCIDEVRPDNPKYRLMIATWRRLPVWITRAIGPRIVRGIP